MTKKKDYCKICGRKFDIPREHNICAVCNFILKHKEEYENIIRDGFWSKEEFNIILEKAYIEKVETINEIVELLNNKKLDDLVNLLNSNIFKNANIKKQVKVKCSQCGKDITVKLYKYINEKNLFCSTKCMGKFKTENYSGINNKKFSKIKCNCDNCGKEIWKNKYRYEERNKYGETHNFCCKKCSNEFRSKYYVGEKGARFNIKLSEKSKNKMRESVIKGMKENGVINTLTKPHIITNSLLDEIKIKYKNEELFKYYSLDIYLVDFNLGIEVMGDYWHGNPTSKYNKKLNNTQSKNIVRDKRKNTFIKKYYGFNILYLWENDILNNTNLCKKLIIKYIENKGVLEDYNSYNYKIENDKLILINKQNP